MGATADEIEAVYRREFDRFLRVATAIVAQEDVAYDVVQDAFARALRHRGRFARRGPLEAWLWRTVVNTARSSRARTEPPAEPPSTNGHPPDERARVAEVVAALPERQRVAVFLRYYADLDYRTIAEVMGVSSGTVGATLKAARDAVRTRLLEVDR